MLDFASAFILIQTYCYRQVRFRDAEVKKEIESGALFDYMKHCDDSGYILSLSTPGADYMTEKALDRSQITGLIGGHAYTLLTVHRSKVGGHRLLKIRNPWGGTEWTGDWSDSSAKWTPELKAEVGFEAADDGIFWMSFDDVVRFFDVLNVCKSRHNHPLGPWTESRHKFDFVFRPGTTTLHCYQTLSNT